MACGGSKAMRIQIALISVLALISVNSPSLAMAAKPAALEVTDLAPGQTRMYSFDLNADDLSRGILKGHYRVITQVTYTMPQNEVVESTSEIINDVTGSTNYTDLAYNETTPWVQTETTLFEINAQGNIVRTVAIQKCNSSPSTTMMPEIFPFSSIPVITLWEGCSVSAQEFTDVSSGHKLLFNFEGRHLTYFSLQKTTPGHYRVDGFFRPRIDSMEAALQITDNIYTMSTRNYKFHELAAEGVNSSTLPCDHAGAVQPVAPMVFPDGHVIQRTEICYPSHESAGFERIVIPLFNPPRGPNVNEVTRIALKHEGHLAKKPFVKVDHLSEVNCHGYAISAIVPKAKLSLPNGPAWLEGGRIEDFENTPNGGGGLAAESTGFSKGTYPFEAVLHEHFHRVAQFSLVDGDFTKQVKRLRDKNLKAGDLITMIDGDEYMHSGVLIAAPRGFWIQSKLGEGPVVETPLQSLLDVYTTSKIEIYRLN
jgi:hypothetical protein